MSLFEQNPPRAGSRFGKLSSSMFFIRNTAKPKRVHHIEGIFNYYLSGFLYSIYDFYLGLNGALICNVNDDPSLVRSTPTSSLNFNQTNLPALEIPRRAERIVPPLGFWNTYGVSKFLFYLINIMFFVFYANSVF